MLISPMKELTIIVVAIAIVFTATLAVIKALEYPLSCRSYGEEKVICDNGNVYENGHIPQ